jgi:hypothetical protein
MPIKHELIFGPARGLTSIECVEIDGIGPGDKTYFEPHRVDLWAGDFYAARICNTLSTTT